ncbi:response regulator transcription factor [Flagellimonas lutaonensis]|uniref:Two component transcriptional regulator, LuxR family n=1 Tax=Flagellimonas lutaonensis TaxID=516051 RepID=A0A0D5YXB4_9FLAO|nr:response regulator transcription factor [Allomuricauda lutaonensis]AKA36514.1 Two component transcriptional regulator, LuxR family [Allomuricauda lutaonensis]
MRTTMTKVIIIDRDLQLHQLYGSYFENAPEYELIGIYDKVSAVLYDMGRSMPDIIISEVSLSGISGLEGIEHLRKRDASIKILIMSQQSDFEIIKKAFKKGANGYLTKPVTRNRLFHALDSIQQYGAALGHDVAKMIISSFQRKPLKTFSKRENQIIEYLGQGFTYKDIAEKLFVTPSTVNFHIQNIYLKLNVNSKSEALEKLRQLEAFQLDHS